jgi:hypothetical protein
VEEEYNGEEEDEQSEKEEEGLALRCAVCRQNYSLSVSLAYFRVFSVKNFINQCFGSVLVAVQIRIQNQHVSINAEPDSDPGFDDQKL